MFDRISKSWRYLRREYPSTTTASGFGLLIGAGIATVVTAGTAAPLFIIPIAAAGGSGFAMLMNGGEWDRESGNSQTIGSYKLVGTKKDLNSIKMTQKLIDKKTAKLKHMADLPEKLQRKLLKHVDDVQGALARVRVYKNYSSEQLDAFTFTREFYDAGGQRTDQSFAICRFVPADAGKPSGPAVMTVPVRPEVPKPVKEQQQPKKSPLQDNKLADGFTDLSRKVEDVARRVDRIENPPEVKLDKKNLRPK
ncbi:MAG: hypothetical protein PW788_15920 [Micavibrio sp.]|nr:hypothetical protein [Micavibrio sp.]